MSVHALRDADGKHRFEDQGMEIISAIRREFLPSMDSNDGGEILCWLTDFADQVWLAAQREVRAGVESPAGQEP